MKTLKRISLALFATSIVFGTGVTAFAGPGHGHGGKFHKLAEMTEEEKLEFLEDRLDKRVDKMQQKLDLDARQTAKVRQILADAQTRSLEIWETRQDADKKELRSQFKEIRKQSRAEIDALLTPVQKVKADQWKAERKKKRATWAKKGKKKMVERLDAELDLSDDQAAQVRSILDAKHDKLKKLKGGEVDDKRAAARQIRQETRTEIEAILDADQKAKYAALREKMKERRGKKSHKHKN